MQYLAPYDLLETTFPDDSVDLVTSRSPLAHYSARYLGALLPVIAKLLRHKGLLSLCFDQRDRLDYIDLVQDSTCRLLVEESDTELRVVSDGEPPAKDPTRSLAFLVASCAGTEEEGMQS
jgi:SAM-dependent methyltransferase